MESEKLTDCRFCSGFSSEYNRHPSFKQRLKHCENSSQVAVGISSWMLNCYQSFAFCYLDRPNIQYLVLTCFISVTFYPNFPKIFFAQLFFKSICAFISCKTPNCMWKGLINSVSFIIISLLLERIKWVAWIYIKLKKIIFHLLVFEEVNRGQLNWLEYCANEIKISGLIPI